MINGMKILASYISLEYLMVNTKEKMYTKLGPEFFNWSGKLVIVQKALYGLIGSCVQFHRHFCEELGNLGFLPSKTDQYLCICDARDHY